MRLKFSEPGGEGDLDPSANIWKKGIVFTRRAASTEFPADSEGCRFPGYRISVGFKRGVSHRPVVGFQDLYGRVFSAGTRRVAELVSANQNLATTASIVCHGWRLLGEGGKPVEPNERGKIAIAFVMLSLRAAGNEKDGEREPTVADLGSPGGSSFEDLVRVEPQRAEEIYNEFDFSNSTSDQVTVSFGENIPSSEDGVFDFGPTVERAEKFARAYHGALASLGEVDTPFRVVRREWFLADPRFVTVHICFPRSSRIAPD
jgi:hypothetical protein